MEENNQFENGQESKQEGLNEAFSQPTKSPFDNAVLQDELQEKKGMAVASLVLGILGVLCCCIPALGPVLSIIGVVLGIISIRKMTNKGLAIAGLVVSSIGVLMGLYWTVACCILISNPLFDWSRIDFNNPEATQKYLEELERSLEMFHLF